MNAFANMIPEDFGGKALGGLFHQAGQFVTETTGTVMQSFEVAAFRAMSANMEPSQIIDKLVEGNPKLAPIAELAKADEGLGNALKEVIVKDDTFAKGIVELSNGEGGENFVKELSNALQNPELRGDITNALLSMAHSDDINFEQLQGLVTAVNEYVPMDPKSDKKVIAAYTALGLPEEDALRALRDGKMDAAKKFMHDLFNNPEEFAGKLGGFLEGLGLPPQVTEFIAGLMPQLHSAMSAMPGVAGNLLKPYTELYSEYGKPWVDETQVAGAENIARSSIPTPGLP